MTNQPKLPWAAPTLGQGAMWLLIPLWCALIAFNVAENLIGLDPATRVLVLDVDEETSIYTWLSGLLLAGAGLLLLVIGREATDAKRWERLCWYGLGAVFFLLSADEGSSLHEHLAGPVKNALHTGGGVLTFAWVLPYGVASVLGLMAIVPFLRTLPRRTLAWFLASAVVYVAGALGMEMVGGVYYQPGVETADYRTAATIEEALEGLGALMFLHALLAYRETRRRARREPESSIPAIGR